MWTYTLLPQILNMSLTGSIVIVFVLICREFMKKSPKIFSYALWAVVLFRLLCPVSISVPFSFLGFADVPATTDGTIEHIPTDIVHTENPAVDLPIEFINDAINERLPQGEEQLRADPLEFPMSFGTLIWIVGMFGMIVYAVASYVDLKMKLIGAVRRNNNIYLCDTVPSPFVVGFIRPKIYLPSALSEQEQQYVILHEQTHINRKDHIIKIIAFIALTIHWFNPLVWVAFIMSSKDMEMSCDEAVMKKLGSDIRAEYSQTLLNLATGKKIIAGTPLAFGEGDTKVRIVNLMNYKSPKFWSIVILVVVTIAVSVGFALNPQPDPARAVAEYDGSIDPSFLDAENPAYELGINSYGVVIFKDADAAFEAAVDDYFYGIVALKDAYELDIISKKDYKDYKKYGAQFESDDVKACEQALAISKFLDLYENSFEKTTHASSVPTQPVNSAQPWLQSVLREVLSERNEFVVYHNGHEIRLGSTETIDIGSPNGSVINYDVGIETGDYNQTFDYDDFTLRYYHSASGNVDILSRIDIVSGDLKTERGISISSTMDEVFKAYPEIAERASEMKAKYVWYDFDYEDDYSSQIIFFFGDDMRVNRMIYEYRAVTMRQKLITSDALTITSGENSITILPNDDIDNVLWLELDAKDDTVPFHIFDSNNKEHHAFFFSVQDAETGEKLDFTRPSGLSPQTYLFQNAKYGGRYIVTMSTGFGANISLVEQVVPDRTESENVVVIDDEISLTYRFGVVIPFDKEYQEFDLDTVLNALGTDEADISEKIVLDENDEPEDIIYGNMLINQKLEFVNGKKLEYVNGKLFRVMYNFGTETESAFEFINKIQDALEDKYGESDTYDNLPDRIEGLTVEEYLEDDLPQYKEYWIGTNIDFDGIVPEEYVDSKRVDLGIGIYRYPMEETITVVYIGGIVNSTNITAQP